MADKSTNHLTLTPKKKVDYKENLPNAYITFNQALLDDEKWYVESCILSLSCCKRERDLTSNYCLQDY
jgi:hypothetical protein